MKISILLLFLSLSCLATAHERFPRRCQPLIVETDRILIHAGQQRLIMIHNLSSTKLWITHTASNASTNWSSPLTPDHWSALAVHDLPITLSCIESRPGHEQQIPCAQVVGVCQWRNTERPAKPSGIYWAAENRRLSPLIAYIGRRGFIVPSSVQSMVD